MKNNVTLKVTLNSNGRNEFEKCRDIIQVLSQVLLDERNTPLGGALYRNGEVIGSYLIKIKE